MSMVKARATSASKVYNKAFKELHRIVEEGEVIELTQERFDYLHGGNKYHINFVELLDPPAVETTVIPEPEEEPEIYIIEPGQEPVQVDENLQPIEKPKKKKSTRKKKTEAKTECE